MERKSLTERGKYVNGGGVQNDNDKEKAVKEERGEEATQRNGRAEGHGLAGGSPALKTSCVPRTGSVVKRTRGD